MKKIMLCFAFLLVCFGACKKDQPVQPLENKIIGKWNWTHYQDTHSPASPNDIDVDMNFGSFFEFNALGTANNLSWSGTYGNTGSLFGTDDWFKVDNNHLTALGSDYTVEVVTDTKLIIVFEETINGVKHVVRYTLTRPFVPVA